MTAARTAVLLALLAGLLVPDPAADARRRLARLRGAASRGPADGEGGRRGGGQTRVPPVRTAWAARAAGVTGGLAAVAGHGGAAAVLVVLAVAVGVPASRRRRAESAVAAAVARDLPRAADLLATCLDAGSAPAGALGLVADAVGGPVAARLRPVAAALGAGADLEQVVERQPVGRRPGVAEPDSVARLVRALARATSTGAPLAAAVRDVAADERERARWLALERARRAGVLAVGPLAACFLPAFVLVGVVPVVVGVAGAVVSGWR